MTEEASAGGSRVYLFGPFRVEADEQLLLKNGIRMHIPGKAFDLLLALLQSAGHLRSREELIKILWPKTIVEEANLTWNMNVLRRTLGDERQNPRYIETVHGRGYRFIAATEPATARQIPTVAVLPFENLSTDPTNIYFTAGIQATIVSKLAGVGALRVISPTSTEQYPSHPGDLKKVATQLGVTSILEGSVQKEGTCVLITVQLIDVRTNNHIWAQGYTRSLVDVFAVENDVAAQVAAALQAKLLPAEAARLASASTRDPHAYLMFLKANYYANQVTSSNSAVSPADAVTQAVTFYRQAIARDPHFALAYAHLSYLESYAYWLEIVAAPQSMVLAEQAARQALALNPELPEAHLAMGYADYYGNRNYPAALAQFERVCQSLPNSAEAVGAVAFIYRRQNQWQEALSKLERAAVLDPRNPRWPYETGVTLMMLGRYDPAEQQFDLALALEPQDYNAVAFKAMTFLLSGKSLQQTRQVLANIPRGSSQQDLISAIQFQIAWLARRPEVALAVLDDAPDWVSAANAVGQEPASFLRAQALALKGDHVGGLRAYQQAHDLLRIALHEQPDDSSLWSFLGLVEAGLGRRSEAINAGLKATSLTSVSKDSLYGAAYLVVLAKIHAHIGEPDEAVKLLRHLLALPAGLFISGSLLERDPTWDCIRENPGFQALLGKSRQHTSV